MSVEFWAAGSALAGTATTLNLVAPTLNVNDIMLAQIASNDNDAHTAPDSTWTAIYETNNGTGLRSSLWWKRAVAGSSGATFTFASFAGTTVNFGIITAYRGCRASGSPIGNTTNSTNASADAVTYATLTPLANTSALVACGFYQEDATIAGTMSGTTPTFVNQVDVETATGNDLSLFQYSGHLNVGGATGAISHATTSTIDAVNQGMLIELLSGATEGGSSGEGSVAYPRRNRIGTRE